MIKITNLITHENSTVVNLGASPPTCFGCWGENDEWIYYVGPSGKSIYKIKVTGISNQLIFSNGNYLDSPSWAEERDWNYWNSPPSTPVWISSTAVATNRIDLKWHDLSNETSYTLYRNTINDIGTAIKIAGKAENVTNHSDIGLAPKTKYYYWLKAFNSFGASGYSTVMSNTTLSPEPAVQPPKYEEPKVEVEDDFVKPGKEKKFDIGVNLDKAGKVTIEVYDIQGNLVLTICRDKQFDRGYHNIRWDLKKELGSGVYWIVMKGEGWVKRKRVAVIK